MALLEAGERLPIRPEGLRRPVFQKQTGLAETLELAGECGKLFRLLRLLALHRNQLLFLSRLQQPDSWNLLPRSRFRRPA